MKNYDFTTLKNAIEDSGGNIQLISQRLGCEWHTAKKYIDENPDALKLYQNEMESVLDLAESKLIENIQSNDNTAIIFYLKTKGKKRGYVEKTEVEHSGNISMPIVTTMTAEELKESLKK